MRETAGGPLVERDAGTRGFLGSLSLGGAYQLGPALRLRAGLSLNLIAGAEKIDGIDDSLSVRTFNTGIALGIEYAL